MNPKIVFAFALLAIAHQAQSACLCGPFGQGKDICSSSSSGKCSPLVIRPAQLPRINPEIYTKPRVVCQTIGGGVSNPFKPIGDLCSCKQSIVVPAIVPRPVCSCSSSSSSSSSSNSNSNSNSQSSSSCGGGPIYVGSGAGVSSSSIGNGYYGDYVIEETGPTAAAVDPVSLALAYKQQNTACGGISEGRLAYGFRKLPVDVVDTRADVVEIDEQGLHAHNGDIVELKKISCGRVSNPDEEALAEIEALEADEFEQEANAGSHGGIKSLRYKDCGFGIAKVHKTPFKQIMGVVEVNPEPVQETVMKCDDGYQPGNVIIRNTPQVETYSTGPGVPADCGDDRDDYRPYFKYNTKSSSSSSSSNSNCNQCAHSRVYY